MARVAVDWRRWLWLVLMLIVGLGGGLVITVDYVNRVQQHSRAEDARIQREAQADLCELLTVFDDPSAPPPTTDRGRAQVAAMRAYRAKRC